MNDRKAYIFPVLNFLFVFCYWNYTIYLPLYLQNKGVGAAGIGRTISLFPLTTLILIFPLGVLADKISAKSLLIAGSIGVTLFGAFMFESQTHFAITLSMLFGGVSFALYTVGLNASFFKLVDERGRWMKTAWYSAGGTLGFGIGPLLGGFLVEKIGAHSIFIENSICGMAMLAASLIAPSAPMIKIEFSEYFRDLKRPAAIIVTLIMLTINTHAGIEQMGFALFMKHIIGLKESQMGEFFFIVAIWISVWSLVAGRFYDAGRKQVLIIGIAILWSGIFQFGFAYSTGFLSMMGYRMAHSLGDAFFNIALLGLVGATFARSRIGGNYGFILMVNTFAIFISHNAAGRLMQGGRYGLPFQVSGMIMIAGGLLILIAQNRITRILESNAESL